MAIKCSADKNFPPHFFLPNHKIPLEQKVLPKGQVRFFHNDKMKKHWKIILFYGAPFLELDLNIVKIFYPITWRTNMLVSMYSTGLYVIFQT